MITLKLISNYENDFNFYVVVGCPRGIVWAAAC